MKRPMTLTGGILGLVAHAIMLIVATLAVVGFIQIIAYEPSSVQYLIASLILVAVMLAVAIIGLVFNIASIKAWNKDAEVFASKKSKLIVALVFNFIGAVLGFIMMSIIYILCALVLIAAAVLLIVDVCMEKKRVGGVEATATVAAPAGDLEDKIEKLNQMKSQGMISEEEYEELKKSYINEKING